MCRRHGLREATFYKWKAKYGGLEEENARPKKLLAESVLNETALRELLEKMVGSAVKREAVAHLREFFAMSERRACRVIAVDSTMVRYRSVRPDDGPTECPLVLGFRPRPIR